MKNQNHTPDTDQKLARKIKAVQDEGRSLLSLDDHLINKIMQYKQFIYESYEPELTAGREICWEQIASGIHEQEKEETVGTGSRVTKNLFPSKPSVLKFAGVFLLTVILSALYLYYESIQPKILIQSDSQITSYTLDDSSKVRLRPNSTLYALTRTDNKIHLKLEGEAFFDIIKREKQRFLVDAGNGIAEVAGTSFNIREWGDKTIIFLQEGSLLFSTSDGSREVILEAGEMLSVTKDLSITEPVKTDGVEYLSWQQGELVFNNRKAESVIKELEHHYSINIIAPEEVKNEVLGGSLSLENRSVSLENLGIVLGGNFSSIGDDTYQFVD